MTQRKYCGFDVNGWRDFVARNWSTLPGDEEEIGQNSLLESGPLTSVVLAGGTQDATWIGGRQADLAPHGRGGGWGQVGDQTRRLSVRDLLSGRIENIQSLAAPFEVAGRASVYNVVAIEDVTESDELFREGILRGLTTAHLRSPMLVWRPVLAALYAIEMGHLSEEATVSIVSQAPKGVSIQTLRIRHANGRTDQVLAPERRQVARNVENAFGYEQLVHRAREAAVGPKGFSARTAHRALASAAGSLALGLPVTREILPDSFGNWDIIDLTGCDITNSLPQHEKITLGEDADLVFVETLAEGSVRDALVDSIQAPTSTAIKHLPPSAVAEGALIAAKRLGQSDPVFFDFLPRMSTIVFGRDGAANFDLIDPKETLEAGRVYRSPQPASFAIPGGHENVSVYLRKEAEPHPRLATVDLGKALSSSTPVSLWVEQTPAAGRARIVLDAKALGRQFSVDWDNAQKDDREWDEIIRSLETPPPSIPARLVLKCGMHPWDDSERADGLSTLLKSEMMRSSPDWTSLASKLSARPFGEYCISSDGDIPSGVSDGLVECLDRLTGEALAINRDRLQNRGGTHQNDSVTLKFLTWQFRRCPTEVAEWLLECIESRDLDMFKHPFVHHSATWVLIYQGLGRIAGNETLERRILKTVLATDIRQWNWRVESACIAFLLSRSDTAPTMLERSDVELLVKRTVKEFNDCRGTAYTKFNYAPFLLAGLLRWRIKERNGLLLGDDPLADQLARAIDASVEDLKSRRRGNENFERLKTRYLSILKDLKDELGGKGGNPNLLLDIYNASGAAS